MAILDAELDVPAGVSAVEAVKQLRDLGAGRQLRVNQLVGELCQQLGRRAGEVLAVPVSERDIRRPSEGVKRAQLNSDWTT